MEEERWKGTPISEFRIDFTKAQFPAVTSSAEHTVLVKIPLTPGKVPECYPPISRRVDVWDKNNVKLPSSEKNTEEEKNSRWTLIREALSSVILSGQQLEAAILSYNRGYAQQWKFAALHAFFEEVCEEEESAVFFQSLLPKMIDLALCLPELISTGIPLLTHGSKKSITLSQMQIASLLANAFFVAFPHRNTSRKGTEYANYPTINFTRLFQTAYPRDRKQSNFEKIRCILNYFRRVTTSAPTGVVTFSRQFVPDAAMPRWWESARKLSRLYVSSEGTIEDEGVGLLQMDFAHKLVGGGAIGNGCVQEEIRFVTYPELIVSRLFTECLGDNEALIITGCERFNSYSGYGKTFEWTGDHVDTTASDMYGRKYCTVLALDAMFFKKSPKEQFTPHNMTRELNKAYTGFSWGNCVKKEEIRCGIATGNWGCGVYKGNLELKSVLQLIAAAEANRDLAYFTFGDEELTDGMYSLHQYLVNNSITVGRIYKLLCQYNARELFDTVGIFEYLRNEAIPNVNEDSEKANDATNVVKPFGMPKLAVTKRSFCYRTAEEGPLSSAAAAVVVVTSQRTKRSGHDDKSTRRRSDAFEVEFESDDGSDGSEKDLESSLCNSLDAVQRDEVRKLAEMYTHKPLTAATPETETETESCDRIAASTDDEEDKPTPPPEEGRTANEDKEEEGKGLAYFGAADNEENCDDDGEFRREPKRVKRTSSPREQSEEASGNGGNVLSATMVPETPPSSSKSPPLRARTGNGHSSGSKKSGKKLSDLCPKKPKLKVVTQKISRNFTFKSNDNSKRKISDYFERKS